MSVVTPESCRVTLIIMQDYISTSPLFTDKKKKIFILHTGFPYLKEFTKSGYKLVYIFFQKGSFPKNQSYSSCGF